MMNPLMPKGVEHMQRYLSIVRILRMMNPLMPKGVEHGLESAGLSVVAK